MNEPEICAIENFPYTPEGYKVEYRGTRWRANNVIYVFSGYNLRATYNRCPYKADHVDIVSLCNANGVDGHYWEFVKDHSYDKSLEELIKEAKTWVGKKIISLQRPDHYGTVESLTFHTKKLDIYSKYAINLDEMIDIHGCAVTLSGKWNDGETMDRVMGASVIEEYIGNPWDDVKVNGYKAEKTSSGFTFGCAKISYMTLNSAFNFLRYNEIEDNQSNRKPESVMIGEGKFTMDILRKLLDK